VIGTLFGTLAGKLISLVVVLVIVVGAGWFFFVREDNEAQKTAAEVSDEVRAAASASATTAATAAATPGATAAASPAAAAPAGASTIRAQAYRIIEGQSEAWYLAPEKLSRLPTSSVAKGTTKAVTGEFHLASGGLDPAKPTKFVVDVSKIASDEGMRDNRMRQALETTKFPLATFTATKLTGMPEQFTAAETVMQLTGTLDLHGVQKETTWELKVKKDGDILSGLGTVQFKYSDFGITKPDVGGFVTVDENVTIQIQLFAAPA